MTNETPQPNVNERLRTAAVMLDFVDLSGAGRALITAWLEVRVLPGPPPNKIKHLAGPLAAAATVIGDSAHANPERQASYTCASRILRIVVVAASPLTRFLALARSEYRYLPKSAW